MCGKITFKSLDTKQEIKIKGDKGSACSGRTAWLSIGMVKQKNIPGILRWVGFRTVHSLPPSFRCYHLPIDV
jgi:hypothetical protein